MKAHLKYFWYVLRHKYYVFKAGRMLGVPLWQLIVHDWSKFLPSEWFPYVAYFYEDHPSMQDVPPGARYMVPLGYTKEEVDTAFDVAWNHHQKRQPHHWQYWLLTCDTGETTALSMPVDYVREMVADWRGAGLALDKPNISEWYEANKDKMILHPETRDTVERVLSVLYEDDNW